MLSTTKTRYKTGEECPRSATWQFDGYTDGTYTPAPTSEEKFIPLSKGEVFPPISSSGKACWRKFFRDA
ncbi:MAG: YjzC family protein [Planctomycetota bacterium]